MTRMAGVIHVTGMTAAIHADGAIPTNEIRMVPRTPRVADTATHAITTIIAAVIIVGTTVTSATRTMTGIIIGTTAIGMATRIATGVINPGAGIGAVAGAPVGVLKLDRLASAFRTDRRGRGVITTTGIRIGWLHRFAA